MVAVAPGLAQKVATTKSARQMQEQDQLTVANSPAASFME